MLPSPLDVGFYPEDQSVDLPIVACLQAGEAAIELGAFETMANVAPVSVSENVASVGERPQL